MPEEYTEKKMIGWSLHKNNVPAFSKWCNFHCLNFICHIYLTDQSIELSTFHTISIHSPPFLISVNVKTLFALYPLQVEGLTDVAALWKVLDVGAARHLLFNLKYQMQNDKFKKINLVQFTITMRLWRQYRAWNL